MGRRLVKQAFMTCAHALVFVLFISACAALPQPDSNNRASPQAGEHSVATSIPATPAPTRAALSNQTAQPTTGMQVETTENQDRAWHEQYFRERPQVIERKGDGVRIVGGINFVVPSGEERLLIAGDQLIASDDHGQTSYEIVRVAEDGIEVQYRSEFDHGAFGSNMRTVDQGRFFVPYHNRAN